MGPSHGGYAKPKPPRVQERHYFPYAARDKKRFQEAIHVLETTYIVLLINAKHHMFIEKKPCS